MTAEEKFALIQGRSGIILVYPDNWYYLKPGFFQKREANAIQTQCMVFVEQDDCIDIHRSSCGIYIDYEGDCGWADFGQGWPAYYFHFPKTDLDKLRWHLDRTVAIIAYGDGVLWQDEAFWREKGYMLAGHLAVNEQAIMKMQMEIVALRESKPDSLLIDGKEYSHNELAEIVRKYNQLKQMMN